MSLRWKVDNKKEVDKDMNRKQINMYIARKIQHGKWEEIK